MSPQLLTHAYMYKRCVLPSQLHPPAFCSVVVAMKMNIVLCGGPCVAVTLSRSQCIADGAFGCSAACTGVLRHSSAWCRLRLHFTYLVVTRVVVCAAQAERSVHIPFSLVKMAAQSLCSLQSPPRSCAGTHVFMAPVHLTVAMCETC